MALFTNKADKDLPWLTKLVQLDIDNDDEVLHFLEHEDNWGEDIEKKLRAASGEDAYEIGLADFPYTEAQKRISGKQLHPVSAYWRKRIECFVRAHRLTVSIMNAIADESGIEWEDLMEIEKAQVKFVFGPAPTGGNPGPVLIKDLTVGRGAVENELLSVTASHLIALIGDAVKQAQSGGNPLARCSECGHPFPTRKPPKKFCSHRCAHREGSRRRYIRKPGKEDSDTGN